MHPSATETFISNMRGPVVRPMDADYDTVRSLYNGMIDKCPMMIARCTDVADVVAAVNFARQNDLQVAIGGGGNFGVVTSFLFQAHSVSTVYAGPVFWDLENARTVMQKYRDFLPGVPEELGAFVGLKTVPPMDPFPAEHQGKRACAIIACYNGPTEDGKAVMAKLLGELPPA